MGDAAFAGWFHKKFPGWLRSVHWNDPVPHLPAAKMGFRHYGRELWWDERSDQTMVCDDSGEDPNCSASIAAALVFTDHWHYLGHKIVQCSPFNTRARAPSALPGSRCTASWRPP